MPGAPAVPQDGVPVARPTEAGDGCRPKEMLAQQERPTEAGDGGRLREMLVRQELQMQALKQSNEDLKVEVEELRNQQNVAALCAQGMDKLLEEIGDLKISEQGADLRRAFEAGISRRGFVTPAGHRDGSAEDGGLHACDTMSATTLASPAPSGVTLLREPRSSSAELDSSRPPSPEGSVRTLAEPSPSEQVLPACASGLTTTAAAAPDAPTPIAFDAAPGPARWAAMGE